MARVKASLLSIVWSSSGELKNFATATTGNRFSNLMIEDYDGNNGYGFSDSGEELGTSASRLLEDGNREHGHGGRDVQARRSETEDDSRLPAGGMPLEERRSPDVDDSRATNLFSQEENSMSRHAAQSARPYSQGSSSLPPMTQPTQRQSQPPHPCNSSQGSSGRRHCR